MDERQLGHQRAAGRFDARELVFLSCVDWALVIQDVNRQLAANLRVALIFWFNGVSG